MLKFSGFEATIEKTLVEATPYQKPIVECLRLTEVVQGISGPSTDDGTQPSQI
jgi:hypothetical protein